MKCIILTVLSLVEVYGQWITGVYGAQNGVEPISAIQWSKYTHILHFAAAPNSNGTVNLLWLTQSEISDIISFRPPGKKVIVEIKDNDSDHNAFSQATAPGAIAAFVTNIVNFVNSSGYDGVDIDWEANINVTQYVDLLTRLRNAMPAKVVAMAAGDWGNLWTVAAASQSNLDQINVMCYDMDNDPTFSWYNDALLQAGTPVRTCDQRVGVFTGAGVAPGKLGIGIPFYGRRWTGCTQALVSGCNNTGYFTYRALVTDATRWQPQYQLYDTLHKSNYLSIPGLNEFDSYNGVQSISDVVAWQKSRGFGGFLTFSIQDEYLPGQTGDARYPLSTALYNAVFGAAAARPPPGGSDTTATFTLYIGVALLLAVALLTRRLRGPSGHRGALEREFH